MTTPPTSSVSPTPPPATEIRLTTIRGDRLCISCGFNLHGQPVVREPVYGMVMVRCPECSTPASLQEYPLLGKWPARLAAVLAAAWFLVLLGGLFASAGITFGMTEATVRSGSEKLATSISQQFADWYATADDKAKDAYAKQWGGTTAPVITVGPYTYVDSAWWDSLDKRSLLANFGGVRYAVNKSAVDSLSSCFIAGLCIGFVWSVFLLGLRRTRLPAFGLLLVGMAFGCELLWGSLVEDRMSRWSSTTIYSHEAAAHILAPYLVAAALFTVLVSLFIGLWTGRPLLRWLVRLLLPPRLVSALSILWIAEGKSLPKPHPRSHSKAIPKPN